MNEKRRAEIKKIISHFQDMKPFGAVPEQKDIDKYCQAMRFETLRIGDFQDYRAQVEHDTLMLSLFPKILAEVQRVGYNPEFETEENRQKVSKQNDEVRINIAKIFEEHAILFRNVDGVGKGLASIVAQTIESAGVTIFNKAYGVLLHIAQEKFGGDFTIQNARDYAQKVYDEKAKLSTGK